MAVNSIMIQFSHGHDESRDSRASCHANRDIHPSITLVLCSTFSTMSAAVANTNRGTTANHYRPGGYVAHQTVAQRAGPNITDDYEREF